MKLDISYYSSHGGRSENEDSLFIEENNDKAIVIVADGVGSCGNGKEASLSAARNISSIIKKDGYSIEATEKAFNVANEILYLKKKHYTTAAVLHIKNNNAIVAHIGDSRIYQIRNNSIIYQSVDHTVSQMAVLVGQITQEQIRGHCDRNKLLKALGMTTNISPDIRELQIESGDIFILCSDGFWELIYEAEMVESVLTSKSSEESLTKMRKIIDNRYNNSDNNTAVIVRVIK